MSSLWAVDSLLQLVWESTHLVFHTFTVGSSKLFEIHFWVPSLRTFLEVSVFSFSFSLSTIICLMICHPLKANLDSILKSRDITLPTKLCPVKLMLFLVVMYGCESWTIKKAKHWRTDAFELWCWRRLLRVPRTARRSNQSILKKISLEYSLEGLMRKLKLWYFGHLMWSTDSLEKDPDAGKD